MGLTWCHGRIAEKKTWTDGLFTLGIRVDGVLPFEPGQFLQVGVDDAVEGHIHRPYSVASPPGEILEFYIVRVDDGKLTPRLDKLRVGDPIEVSQRAAGSFTLSHTPTLPQLWLVGTGTGLAPYIAMLRTETPWRDYQKIVVVHGVRKCADLSYTDELKGFAQAKPDQFVYIPSATREECPDGLSGRVTNLLADGSLEEFAGCQFAPESSAVMLCGNPAMLEEMESMLESRGLKKHRKKNPGNIVVERYW